jgi:prepilin peptidase CpaA
MALLAELPIVTLGLCTLSGLAMLGLGIALYAAGLMGGGDGKLAGATALWLGPAALPQYLAYTAIIGGLLALVVLAARVAPVPPALARVRWVRLLRSPRVGVPYGVALAAAGAIALADSPLATVAGP